MCSCACVHVCVCMCMCVCLHTKEFMNIAASLGFILWHHPPCFVRWDQSVISSTSRLDRLANEHQGLIVQSTTHCILHGPQELNPSTRASEVNILCNGLLPVACNCFSNKQTPPNFMLRVSLTRSLSFNLGKFNDAVYLFLVILRSPLLPHGSWA